MEVAPVTWKVGKTHIPTMDAGFLEEGFDGDPRGILWVYEEPQPNAGFTLGLNIQNGLTHARGEFSTHHSVSVQP